MRKRKRTRFVALIGCIAMLLTGCRIGNTQIVWKNAKINSRKYVFQINDKTCDLKQAKLYLCNYQNLYGHVYGMDLWQYDFGEESLEAYVKDVTIQELVRIAYMNLLAEQMNMSLSAEEETLVTQAAKAYYDSLTEAERTYMDVRQTDIDKAYREYALAKKLYDSLTEGIDEEVSDDEARVIRVQQIYVKDLEQARVVQEKLAEGNDFTAIAGVYNQAAEMERSVARDELPQEVENIAFNLENDAVSEMIETEDGYYFIKCISKLEEQLTEENKDIIREKRRMAQFDEAYQTYVESADFEMNDELWEEVRIEHSDEITTDSFFQVYTSYFEGNSESE